MLEPLSLLNFFPRMIGLGILHGCFIVLNTCFGAGSVGPDLIIRHRRLLYGFHDLVGGRGRFGRGGRLFIFRLQRLLGGFWRFFRLSFVGKICARSAKVRMGSLPSFMASVMGMKGFGLDLG